MLGGRGRMGRPDMKPFKGKMALRDVTVWLNSTISFFFSCCPFFLCRAILFVWPEHCMLVGNCRMMSALRCVSWLPGILILVFFIFISLHVCRPIPVVANRASGTRWWSTSNGMDWFFDVFICLLSIDELIMAVICYVLLLAGTIDPVKFPKRCTSCWFRTATRNKVGVELA